MKLIDYTNEFGQRSQLFEAEVGDVVWFAEYGVDGLRDGVVVMILWIPGDDAIPHYLIQCETSIGNYYVVRDGHTISEYKDRPMAWLRGVFCG